MRVKVTPNATREYIRVDAGGIFEVGVREKAQGGMANERIIELIAEYHEVPVKNVMVVNGTSSRGKTLRIYKSPE